ncbi:hypothetical protein ABIE85_007117 [Bradyrhizobium diazoefficiens]|jgi:hypothetical protein|uniref:Uncharacterized protein n=1 Tax=Bradyrhizobium diazoefficiens TaxID=1355477 RepID=A0A809XKG1_9BRAD|nr:hypothetical protein [Bradyrhizobium diazoefficiens]MBP1060173.1 hypothetical protein [Bradyrhizobium japonicum]AWO88246.1 hypothetical protein DI395_06510 [Bradyrhizobium diazoefficiens]WLA57471.1 hypothetical protein QIH81_01610 [Bradyrhizobium diazoefficiens]BCA00302.1 hypothetical protein H12S4_12060 [Bradyrhizobium diazoefficiens]BCA17986.1 hypothetical protein BDHH15_12010 [Bradyrhizobium diazoefficiens]
MTWIIGASSLLGYGVMLSDVRVTFPNGSTADMLRKAFPISPYIAAGFAGSVYIGYRLLSSLHQFLFIPPSAPDQVAWQPEWVAEHWAPEARKIFSSCPISEQKLGVRFLMVGVSPDQDMGAPEIPRVYLIRFSGPHFVPGYMRKGLNVVHIGSGSNVKRYTRAFREHFRFGASSLRAEIGGQNSWAQMLGTTADLITGEHPVQGVSPHMHVIVCRLGDFAEGTNNRRTYIPNASEPVSFEMPKVASSYGEFLEMCRDRVVGAEGAVG